MSVITFSPNVGPILFDAVLSEDHESELEITGNPIETGAEVNDHAYVKPKTVTVEVADSNAALVYNALIEFQETRIPFFMVTGLRLYRNMLISSIKAQRDRNTSRILRATIVMKEVNIVDTGTAPASEAGGTRGKPGGAKSRTATPPSEATAADTTTADSAANTVKRGDTPATTVEPVKQQSLLKGLFG